MKKHLFIIESNGTDTTVKLTETIVEEQLSTFEMSVLDGPLLIEKDHLFDILTSLASVEVGQGETTREINDSTFTIFYDISI